MLICGYCGGQLSINVIFEHAHSEHAVPRYDERVYIPTYEVYRNLSVEVSPENVYAIYIADIQSQIHLRYEALLANLGNQPNRPALDIGANEMGTNVQLYTPGNFVKRCSVINYTNSSIHSRKFWCGHCWVREIGIVASGFAKTR